MPRRLVIRASAALRPTGASIAAALMLFVMIGAAVAANDGGSDAGGDAGGTASSDQRSKASVVVAAASEHAWLIGRTGIAEHTLLHVPLDDERETTLAARIVTPLESMPLAMAAHGERLVLVFGPLPVADGDEDAGGEQARNEGDRAAGAVTTSLRVRTTSLTEYRPGLYGYRPMAPLPPLDHVSEPHDVAVGARSIFVLSGDGLFALERRTWRRVPLPVDAPVAELAIDAGGGDGVVLMHAEPGGGLRVYRGSPTRGDDGDVAEGDLADGGQSPAHDAVPDSDDAQVDGDRVDDAEEIDGADAADNATDGTSGVVEAWFVWSEPTVTRWASTADPIERTARVDVAMIDESLLRAAWLDDAPRLSNAAASTDGGSPSETHATTADDVRLHLGLVRSDGVVECGVFGDIPTDAAMQAAGDGLLFAWRVGDRQDDGSLSSGGGDGPTDADDAGATGVSSIAVVHWVGIDGSTRMRGSVTIERGIATNQLQVGILVLGSLMTTVLLYVLRRDADARGPVTIGEGVTLADPGRRLIAGLIDGALALAVLSIVWGDPLRWWTENIFVLLAEEGAAPLIVWVLALASHMAATEAVFATTPGKALLRLRTITRRGRRIGVKAALARSWLKAVCPFSALLLLLEPTRPHPAAFGSYVVMNAKPLHPDDGGANGARDDGDRIDGDRDGSDGHDSLSDQSDRSDIDDADRRSRAIDRRSMGVDASQRWRR
jgi:uncharacterized RDD family membrane protein YckC